MTEMGGTKMGRELPPADELAIILKWVKQWEEQDREETKRKEAETKEEIDSLNGLSLRAAISVSYWLCSWGCVFTQGR